MKDEQSKGVESEKKLIGELDNSLFDSVSAPLIEAVKRNRESQILEKKKLLSYVKQACESAIDCIDKLMEVEEVKDKNSFQNRRLRAPKALEVAIKVLSDKVYRPDDWQTKCIKDLASANRFKAGLGALRARVGSGQAALSKKYLDEFEANEAIAFFVKVSQSLINAANAKKGKAKVKDAKAATAVPNMNMAVPTAKEPAVATQFKVI